MIRRLVLTLAAVAAFTPITAFAGTVPPHINLHNGYIEVHNNIELRGGAAAGAFTFRLRHDGRTMQEIQIAAGGVGFFNVCCIAAGTMYEVEIDGRFYSKWKVRPQLCNVRAIPFGYAVTVLNGYVSWNSKEHFKADFQPAVPTVPCPTS